MADHDYEMMERLFDNESELAMNAFHRNWRVRYAAAVAMGESMSEKWLDTIEEMLSIEQGRNLYSQPRVEFINSYDDTRMAEQLVPIEVVFDQEYPDDLKEDWSCRGRVRQACLFAVCSIGKANDAILKRIYGYLDDSGEDSAVRAAGARALRIVGNADSIPHLEKSLEKDEWCLQMEAKKAIAELSGHAQACGVEYNG